MDDVDKQLITIVQPIVDMVEEEVQKRGLPNTPETRISLYDEVSTELLGGMDDASLLKQISSTIVNWLIEQECLNIRVFGN